MSIGSRGNYDPPNTHHCDGCECPEEPEVPTVAQARELLESIIPAMLEDMRQEFGPYRILFPWISEDGLMYMRFARESEEDLDLRMGVHLSLASDNGEAKLSMNWNVFGYSVKYTRLSGWRIGSRGSFEGLEQENILNELTHSPAMREAIALLSEWLKDMRRSVSSTITKRTRARLAPDTPAGKTSDAQKIAGKLVEVTRAYELHKHRGERLEGIVQQAIEGIETSKSHVKSTMLQALREALEDALAKEKKYDGARYVHI